MSEEIINNLGPLTHLAGIWEGSKGDDIAPADERTETENNKFRERFQFEPMGPANNHEQQLYGLRYSRTAWRLGEANAFHEDLGYFLWDKKAQQVLRCFIIPRGIAVLAGGTVKEDAKEFKLSATAGSDTYGICSNKFLDAEFKTVSYDLKITYSDSDSFSYEEDTQLKIKGQDRIFHHTDKNTLKRISKA